MDSAVSLSLYVCVCLCVRACVSISIVAQTDWIRAVEKVDLMKNSPELEVGTPNTSV